MIEVVESFANMPEHEMGEMCVVILMSHGNKDVILSRDGREVPISSLLDKFTTTNCPSLAGKPKLFIIQTCRYSDVFAYFLSRLLSQFCRGQRNCMGRRSRQQPTTDSLLDTSADVESARDWDNTLICWSTVEGYVSYRDLKEGSWLISAMCKVSLISYSTITNLTLSIMFDIDISGFRFQGL